MQKSMSLRYEPASEPQHVMVLTGPNTAGKSTVMRSVRCLIKINSRFMEGCVGELPKVADSLCKS